MRRGSPDDVALELSKEASIVVCDRGYLRHQRRWRERLAAEAGKRVIQVEGDVAVPVETASNKAEYAARTIRPKLGRLWPDFLDDPGVTRVRVKTLATSVDGDFDISDPHAALRRLDLDRSVAPVSRFRGGTSQAVQHLERFLERGLSGYATARSDPSDPQCSFLSPYLHFGQFRRSRRHCGSGQPEAARAPITMHTSMN